jgi:hypothetical protein
MGKGGLGDWEERTPMHKLLIASILSNYLRYFFTSLGLFVLRKRNARSHYPSETQYVHSILVSIVDFRCLFL